MLEPCHMEIFNGPFILDGEDKKLMKPRPKTAENLGIRGNKSLTTRRLV